MEKEEKTNIGSSDKLESTNNEPIGIRVKTMDSTEILVKAFPTDSILNLKNKISEKINLGADRQRLIF